MERRKHKRYPAKEGVYAQLRPDSKIVGKIVNFSRGGVCFRYLFNADQIKERKVTDMSIRNNGVSIEMIPCKTVCDVELSHGPLSSMDVETRQRSVKFGELTYHKASQLEYFLRINTES